MTLLMNHFSATTYLSDSLTTKYATTDKPHVRLNFWGDEAATFAHNVGAGLVVPMHYEMFDFNTETPELFVATAEQLGQPYRVLRCGELLKITKGLQRQ